MSTARALFLPSDIEAAAGGRIAAGADNAPAIRSVVVDSRAVSDGCLFVALPGERTDGHEFLEQAARAGAAALLVSEVQASRRAAQIAALASRHGVLVVAVRDTLAALQDLARLHMRRCAAVTRIGVTGSNGKTTTKEIIGSIIGRTAPTMVNEGNLNSEIGLPVACFSVTEEHRYAVLEMGMNHRGEMDVLADIVRPDLALITNVGTAHIGLLGSRENIAREKKRIFAHFDGRQAGFLPEGDSFRAFLAEGVPGRMMLFGPGSTQGFTGSESRGLGGTIIHWEGLPIRFPLLGPHNLANALGAISVARELGVPNAEIRDGLEAVTPLFGRSQVIEGPVTVIVDCYNANPDSMDEALAFLEALSWPGRRIAVLGGMRELGEDGPEAHARLGRRLRASPVDEIVLFGEEMGPAWSALQGAPSAAGARWILDIEELGADLAGRARAGDLVLLKGSRGLAMERVLPRITPPAGRPLVLKLLFGLKAHVSLLNIFQYITFRAAYAAITALLISFLFGPTVIAKLRAIKTGWTAREDTPETHKAKAGTPTMGGVLIILSVAVSTVLWQDPASTYTWLLLFAALGFGAIGFADDFLKMAKRGAGISAGVKFGGQVLVSALIVTVLYIQRTDTTTLLYVPFIKWPILDLSWGYIPFAVILMVGYSNAVNLTDGLDGLAIGLVIMVGLALTVIAYLTGRVDYADYLSIPFVKGGSEIAIFTLSVVGAAVGFLWFNAHPADVWMGDTGSLALGGVLGVVALIIKKEILILILGGVFVLETLSVAIQVLSYKLRKGKRVFKMAPLHHHFELSGWPESKVVTRLWILGGLFAILGLSTLKIQ